MTTPKNILVVDDHPIVRSSIAAFLANTCNSESIAEAAQCKEAVAHAASGNYGIAIVDLELPDAKASAIVLKGEDTMELQTAVESVTAGMPYFSQRFLTLADVSYGLSDRATEVLSLIAMGLSSREIAQRIFVSENTVEYHRKLILRCLDAKNNAHAVSIAIARGLLDGNIL